MVNSRARGLGTDVEKGKTLERAVRTRMADQDIRGIKELTRVSGVGADTLYAWFRGERVPQPGTLLRVAKPLRATIKDLWPYDAPEPPPVGVEALVGAVTDLVAEMRLDRERGQDAASAMIRAAEALLQAQRPQGAAESTEQPAPDDTR